MQPPFDIAADLDTPVSAYLKLKPFKPRFLLESVEGGERLAVVVREARMLRDEDDIRAVGGELNLSVRDAGRPVQQRVHFTTRGVGE